MFDIDIRNPNNMLHINGIYLNCEFLSKLHELYINVVTVPISGDDNTNIQNKDSFVYM